MLQCVAKTVGRLHSTDLQFVALSSCWAGCFDTGTQVLFRQDRAGHMHECNSLPFGLVALQLLKLGMLNTVGQPVRHPLCRMMQLLSACWVQVDGIENPKVQSVYFPDTPLHKAAFANDGAQVSLLYIQAEHIYQPCFHCMLDTVQTVHCAHSRGIITAVHPKLTTLPSTDDVGNYIAHMLLEELTTLHTHLSVCLALRR